MQSFWEFTYILIKLLQLKSCVWPYTYDLLKFINDGWLSSNNKEPHVSLKINIGIISPYLFTFAIYALINIYIYASLLLPIGCYWMHIGFWFWPP